MSNRSFDLVQLAKKAMYDRGLEPEFSKEATQQLQTLNKPASPVVNSEDLRSLLWCSIDNDDSRDLDQLTYAQKEKNGQFTLWIAIADVDALVTKDSAIDANAQINTTSIYTPAKVFSMLPEKLSTDLTSLNENEDRTAIVIKIEMDSEGEILNDSISQAVVRNYAQLTYKAVGAWLEERASLPEKIKKIPDLQNALLCQHQAAQILKQKRHLLGALTLESPEIEAKVTEDKEICWELPTHNFASELIENFMIAANHVMARRLKESKMPSLRRVVRIPKRWDRIQSVAASVGEQLPDIPDPIELEIFLAKRKNKDPETFPNLSLTVIKLLGRGEYIVENAGDEPIGHFGLALSEYTHSTAPNRRFPDLIAQRQYKAILNKKRNPYTLEELNILAEHCTHQEDAAVKVERHMNKVAAAILLSSHIGETFQAIVTGSGENGTWARIFSPPVEGKILKGFERLDVGDRVMLELVGVDILKGYINFYVLPSQN